MSTGVGDSNWQNKTNRTFQYQPELQQSSKVYKNHQQVLKEIDTEKLKTCYLLEISSESM